MISFVNMLLPVMSLPRVTFLSTILLLSMRIRCHGFCLKGAKSTGSRIGRPNFSIWNNFLHDVGAGDQNLPASSQFLSEASCRTRRELFQNAVGVSAVLGTGLPIISLPSLTLAAEGDASEILLRLRSIPTFSIVDPSGVPFMIFDGRASATGYFFLSFQVAAQALQDARQKDKNAGASEVWANAKIIVVPLAVALQLTLRKSQREAVNNGIKFNTYNDIVPSQEGVDDAKELEKNSNPGKWEQKGRVPLFYLPGLTLTDGREPRYFNQRDVLLEWDRQHPGMTPPPVQIVELVDLFRIALKSDLNSVANLAIMPVQESNQVASKLVKSSDGPLPSYNFNKVFLVGSAQG